MTKIPIFSKKAADVDPMRLEIFYKRIEESEKALQRGEIIRQESLREEIKTWKKA